MTHQQRATWVMQLLNVLLASGVNVYRLRLCWKRTFWARAVMKMIWCETRTFWEIVIANRVCCYSVNNFWDDMCATQYEFIVVNGQTTTSAFHKVV